MDWFKDLLDGSAVVALLGVLADVLTAWASGWTIIWLSIRIYESKTCQDWLNRRNDHDDKQG